MLRITLLCARIQSVPGIISMCCFGMSRMQSKHGTDGQNRGEKKSMRLPITGSVILDVLCLLCFGWVGAFILIPVAQWIEYKRDCKKYGKDQADEIWERMR